MKTVYLDNGATSFPKPEGVSLRMKEYLDCVGATVNRSVYESAAEAGMVLLSCRERLARLFHFEDPTHVILTPGMTAGMNMVIKGYLRAGDHVIVSSMEHNAVMRPLVQMEAQGVRFDRVPCDREGRLPVSAMRRLFRENTRLCIIAHGSNVSGTVQDAESVGRLCEEMGVPFVLDAAQTAGHIDVDFARFRLAALCVPGHKGLLGPGGIGALLLRPDFAAALTPLIAGGTGSASDSEELPPYMPDRFESGTPNMPGVYGLEAALRFIEEKGIPALRAHECRLMKRFLDGARGIEGVRLVGPTAPEERVGVYSLDFIGRDNAEVAFRLETEYGILTRCGLHCAPSAHKTLDTFPQGTVRFSTGFSTTEEKIDLALSAIAEIARSE